MRHLMIWWGGVGCRFWCLILTLNFDAWFCCLRFWRLILTLYFDAWFWHLILSINFEYWFWHLILTLDFDPWFWCLILMLDFDAWFWWLIDSWWTSYERTNNEWTMLTLELLRDWKHLKNACFMTLLKCMFSTLIFSITNVCYDGLMMLDDI